MSGLDDLNAIDDLLGDVDLELEARFEELERRADLDEVRAEMHTREAERAPSAPGAADPLKDLKAAFDHPSAAPRREFLLALCPACGRKNRLDRARATTAAPRCGACGADLVFWR